MNDITHVLQAADRGEPEAADRLLPLVYDQLRALAAEHMVQERAGHTLQATALVHEAYLRVTGSDRDRSWDGRRHFFAAAAEAMRRILIDRARHRNSRKAGGHRQQEPLDAIDHPAAPDGPPAEDLLALDEALTELEAEDPVKAQLVKLRYFAGAGLEEAAHLLGVSPATAKRYWVYARSWLYGRLTGG